MRTRARKMKVATPEDLLGVAGGAEPSGDDDHCTMIRSCFHGKVGIRNTV